MERYARHAAYAAIALVFLWTVAWMIVAERVVRQAEAWRAAQDISLGWDSIEVKGWPFAWRATAERPRAAGAGSVPWNWAGGRAVASFVPWRPDEIRLLLPGEQRVSAAGRALAVRAARPDAVLRLDSSGRLARLDLDFEALEAALDGAAPSRIRKLDASVAPGAGVLDATLRLQGLRLAEALPGLAAFGTDIARAEFAGQLRGLPASAGTFANAARAWRDAGGTLEATTLALEWGPLRLAGEGTLALDDRDRPLGAGTVRLSGWAEAIDAFQAVRAIEPVPAALLKGGLSFLSRAGGSEPGTVRVPVAAQDGRLVVHRIPVASLPRLPLD